MRVALLALAVALAASCRTPTAVTIHVLTDVPCDKLQGVVVAAGAPAEIETLAPAGRAEKCVPARDGLYDVGTIVVVPRSDRSARIAVRAVLGVRRDAEACTSANGYAGCIVARRILHYLPHTELTVRMTLRQDCTDVACDANTTCVDKTCGGAEIDPGKCVGEGCGENVLPTARPCSTPGEVKCEKGERLTCIAGVYRGEDCGIACSPTRCIGASSVVAMGASGQPPSTCALVDGKVWCWGNNTDGRLGITGGPSPTPVEVPGLPRIVQLSSMGTSSHVLALDDAGNAWCWGAADSRQCGAPIVTTALPRKVAGVSNVVQVAASSNSSCFRLKSGAVQCIGSNSRGQLGRGVVGTGDEVPRDVIKTPAWSGVATDVVCASNACCIVDDAKKVACFGNNSSGQVGAGLPDPNVGTPSSVSLPGPVRFVRSGDNAFCAALENGSVFCWGNSGWNLFVDPKPNQSTPLEIPALKGKGVVDLAIGIQRGHLAATRGTTWGWGTAGLVKGPVAEVPSLARASAVSASFEHACAIVTGAVLCWGSDANAIGHGGGAAVATPTPVKWPF